MFRSRWSRHLVPVQGEFKRGNALLDAPAVPLRMLQRPLHLFPQHFYEH